MWNIRRDPFDTSPFYRPIKTTMLDIVPEGDGDKDG